MAFIQKANFAVGEVDPILHDRIGEELHGAAAKRLSNWWVDSAGGVTRRVPTGFVRQGIAEFPALVDGRDFTTEQIYPIFFRFRGTTYLIEWYLGSLSGSPSEKVFLVRGSKAGLGKAVFGNGQQVGGETDQTVFFAEVIKVVATEDEPDQPLPEVISYTQIGPSLFFSSQYFLPQRAFVQTVDESGGPDEGDLVFETPDFYEEVIGTVEISQNSSTWTAVTDSGAVYDSQLRQGMKVRFEGREYTVASVTSATEFTTSETYAGVSRQGKLAKRVTLSGSQLTGTVDSINNFPQGFPPRVYYEVQVFGSGTAFLSEVVVGDVIRMEEELLRVTEVVNDTELRGERDTPMSDVSGADIYLVEGEMFKGNLPRVTAAHKGRLIFAGTRAAPTEIWASAPNDPFLLFGYSVDADAPINVELLEDGLEDIRWLTSRERLYIGGNGAEYTVGEPGEPLTPATFLPQRVGSTGSASRQATVSGGVIVHVGRSGEQMHALRYEWDTQAYQSIDLNRFNRSVLEDGVKQYIYRPPVLGDRAARLFVLTEKGELRVCMLDETSGTVGWSRMALGDPYLEPQYLVTDGRDVALVAKREVESEISYVYLVLGTGTYETPFLMDSMWSQTASGTGQITVPTHLNGGTISVFLADGSYIGDFDASPNNGTDADIDLGSEYADEFVHFGYLYPSDSGEIELLPASVGDPQGPLLGRKHRLLRVIMSVLNTRQIQLNGRPLLGSVQSADGTDLPERTGYYEHRMLGWGRAPETRIAGASYYPATLRSVVREYSQ